MISCMLYNKGCVKSEANFRVARDGLILITGITDSVSQNTIKDWLILLKIYEHGSYLGYCPLVITRIVEVRDARIDFTEPLSAQLLTLGTWPKWVNPRIIVITYAHTHLPPTRAHHPPMRWTETLRWTQTAPSHSSDVKSEDAKYSLVVTSSGHGGRKWSRRTWNQWFLLDFSDKSGWISDYYGFFGEQMMYRKLKCIAIWPSHGINSFTNFALWRPTDLVGLRRVPQTKDLIQERYGLKVDFGGYWESQNDILWAKINPHLAEKSSLT